MNWIHRSITSVLTMVILVAGTGTGRTPQAGHPSVSAFRLRDRVVGALFQSYDASGCVLTGVTVNSEIDSTNHASLTGLTNVTIDVVDICTGIPYISAVGTSVQPGVLTIAGDLSSAHLVMVVPMIDNISFEQFDAAIDITWIATGPLNSEHSHTITHDGIGTTIIENLVGKDRPATAAGMMLAPGTSVAPLTGNQIPGSSMDATINKLKDGTITIIRH